MDQLRVLIGSPSGGTISTATARALRHPAAQYDYTLLESESSCGNFNKLWVQFLMHGLRGDYTHAVMVHADLNFGADQPPFVDVLMQNMQHCGAEVLAAAIPFKDARGLVTTGVAAPDDPWEPLRRLTIRELAKLPDNFGAAELGYPGLPLLVNHGAILFDLRSPKWYAGRPNGRAACYFEFREEVCWRNGIPQYRAASEDWVISRMFWQAGLDVQATKALRVVHLGQFAFPSVGDWGTMEHDEELRPVWEKFCPPAECTKAA